MRALIDFLYANATAELNEARTLVLVGTGALTSLTGHPLLSQFKRVVCLDPNPLWSCENRIVSEQIRVEYIEAGVSASSGYTDFYNFNFPRFDGFSSIEALRARCTSRMNGLVSLTQVSRVQVHTLRELLHEEIESATGVAFVVDALHDSAYADLVFRQAREIDGRFFAAYISREMSLQVNDDISWRISHQPIGLGQDVAFMAVAPTPDPVLVSPEKTALVSELETKIESLETHFKVSMAQERTHWQDIRKALESENAALREKLEGEKQEIRTRLESENAALRERLGTTESLLEDARADTARLFSDLEQGLVDADLELKAQKTRLEAESGAIVSNLQSRLKTEEESAATLLLQKQTLEKELKNCRDDLTGARQELSLLKQHAQELQSRQKLMNEELMKAEGQIELIKDLLLGERDML